MPWCSGDEKYKYISCFPKLFQHINGQVVDLLGIAPCKYVNMNSVLWQPSIFSPNDSFVWWESYSWEPVFAYRLYAYPYIHSNISHYDFMPWKCLCITDHFWEESISHWLIPHTKANNVVIWCFFMVSLNKLLNIQLSCRDLRCHDAYVMSLWYIDTIKLFTAYNMI